MKKRVSYRYVAALAIMLCCLGANSLRASTLEEVQKAGVLRHLGVPYANFISGSGDGLDCEMMRLFAQHLQVRYEYVPVEWSTVIPSLIGRQVDTKDPALPKIKDVPVRGDIISCGMTIIPWREKLVHYSEANFPTQVWLIARSDSTMKPIVPSKSIEQDIVTVKDMLKDRCVMGKLNTCLDPKLYNLYEVGAQISLFEGALNLLAPAVIKGEADATLLDVPDALVALERFPGSIKVIGPISPRQQMGVAFTQDAPQLRAAYNAFFKQCWNNGIYFELVKKYYPAVFGYYPEFFDKNRFLPKEAAAGD